jgi:sialidase-1
LAGRGESFEELKVGTFERLESEVGQWVVVSGAAEVHRGHARTGDHSLRILGGKEHVVELLPTGEVGGKLLSFWAERWTARAPFVFRVEAKRDGRWEEIDKGDRTIRVGGFLTEVAVVVPEGTERLRFRASSPEKSGVMLDDVTLEKIRPMTVREVTMVRPVIPALIRKKDNPVVGLKVVTEGRAEPLQVNHVLFDLRATCDFKSVRILTGSGPREPGKGRPFGEGVELESGWAAKGEMTLSPGENYLWVSVELADDATLDGRVMGRFLGLKLRDGSVLEPEEKDFASQRIGYALRLHGDDGSKAFRIPGLATTKAGTLIAVYDVRYRGGGDLPGDIDVGMSRSTDGGRTWEDMQIIMDMGSDPKWRFDGVGDPAVLVDEVTGRIWVAGIWSHGNRGWHGSGQGLNPEETGQLMLVWSDDDGRSWSRPRNITREVKKPEWHFLLQGPGAGITMKDGTLVFAAQYQDGDKDPNGRKKRTPFSTLISSRDRGKSWQIGTGIKSDTTEAQVVELSDGSLMLNCRDNRGGARTVGVTRDLGMTWEMHPTDRKALPEPVCMASLLRVGDRLLFSNPASKRGRFDMTIKVSEDDGMTWPEKWHTLYDSRLVNGYSCLAPIEGDRVGVLYEGQTELFFLRFPLAELLK